MKTNVDVNNKKVTHCQNCGAPATKEICSYCKGASGIDKNFIMLEYPVIECKEANISFNSVVYPLILAVALAIAAVISIKATTQESMGIASVFGVFMAIASGHFFSVGTTPIFRYNTLVNNGEIKEALVHGYMKDEFIINGRPSQIVKLLIDTKQGKKFILYQLEDTKQPYKIKSKVKIKVYNDIYQIIDKQQYYFD